MLGPPTPASFALGRAEKALAPDDPLLPFVHSGRNGLKLVTVLVEGLLAFARSGAQPDLDGRARLNDVVESVLENNKYGGHRGENRAPSRSVRGSGTWPARPVSSRASSETSSRTAIKYMGHSEERLVTARAEEREDVIHVEVIDTGDGIPPGVEEAIFEPYIRAHAETTGIGLGLATVKRLTSAHGGSAGMARRPGGGCIFWFELPMASHALGKGTERQSPA